MTETKEWPQSGEDITAKKDSKYLKKGVRMQDRMEKQEWKEDEEKKKTKPGEKEWEVGQS